MHDDVPTDIAFRRPGLLPLQAARRLAWLILAILAGVYSANLQANAETVRLMALGAEIAAFVVLTLLWQIWLRQRGGPPPIRLGPEVVTLPRSPSSLRTVMVAYKDIRSATVLGQSWRARLILDTARGAFVYPLNAFVQPDAVALLRQGLQRRIAALPDGEALWSRIATRHGLADDLAANWSWACWAAVGVLLACFVAFVTFVPQDQGFAPIDAGANAAALVQHGEWFRLVTGNLLHASPRHVIGNCAMLVLLGTMLERLVGPVQFLVVLLATAIISQMASAAWALDHGTHLYAVGASGAIFGVLGALGVLTWRFRGDLPGGYRLPLRVWIVLVGLNMLLLPLFQPQVDKAAHLGGLLAGLWIGLLLVLGRADLRHVTRPRMAVRAALALLLGFWAAGIGASILHAHSEEARRTDRYRLASFMLAKGRFAPPVDNLVAWSIATDAKAPNAALADARLLVHQGIAQAEQTGAPANAAARRAAAFQLFAVTDTEAALDYRLGYAAKAVELEAGIDNRSDTLMRHMALFLDRATRDSGPPTDMPAVSLDHNTIHLDVPYRASQGGEIYALLYRGPTLRGVMLLRLAPGFQGEQILPLPVKKGAPAGAPPDPLWTDGGTRIAVARYDLSGCHCGAPFMGPWFTAFDISSSDLP